MKEYSPKRRTAVVFTGTGVVRRVPRGCPAGARRERDQDRPRRRLRGRLRRGRVRRGRRGRTALRSAGLLGRGRLVVVLPAAPRAARGARCCSAMSFGVFLLPLVLALLAGLLFPLGLLLDLVAPATAASLFAWLQALPSAPAHALPGGAVRARVRAVGDRRGRGRLARSCAGAAASRRPSSRRSTRCPGADAALAPAVGGRARLRHLRRRRLPSRSSAAATWRCSPRTSGSRASAS